MCIRLSAYQMKVLESFRFIFCSFDFCRGMDLGEVTVHRHCEEEVLALSGQVSVCWPQSRSTLHRIVGQWLYCSDSDRNDTDLEPPALSIACTSFVELIYVYI